jgi:hypothetical protein
MENDAIKKFAKALSEKDIEFLVKMAQEDEGNLPPEKTQTVTEETENFFRNLSKEDYSRMMWEQFEELSIRKLVGFGGMLLDEPAEPHNRAQRLWTAAPRPLRSSQARTLPRTMWV